jgi:hypothetical protein
MGEEEFEASRKQTTPVDNCQLELFKLFLSPHRFGGQREKIVNSTKTKTEVKKRVQWNHLSVFNRQAEENQTY